MENFEKNDSTKDVSLNALSDAPVRKQSDEAPIEEKEILKTDADASVEDAVSQDVQDEKDGPVEVRETDDGSESVQEPSQEAEPPQEAGQKAEPAQESSVSLEKGPKPADDMESLMDMYEESFKRFAEGAVVTGRIISVDKDHVLVDIGYKSEGQIRTHEFMDEDGNLNATVGDPVDVMVEWWDDEEERVVLSKEKAAKVKVWEDIKKAYEEEKTVEGVITNRVKGGFSVDIGVQAFLPGSQADLRPIRKLDEMVGKKFTFKILKYNRKRSNIVLSRRAILEEERSASRASTLASIHDGKVVEGVIKNITEYGVFVDLGGVDGLLHITDISWGRVKHPSELFSVGDNITVKVLNLDLEKERVSLGKKTTYRRPLVNRFRKIPGRFPHCWKSGQSNRLWCIC
jgi:small subunit ribosomal protein S1